MPQSNAKDFTLGVEEEYQLVDERGGELRSRARTVLASSWTGDVKPEMQQNTVEVGTRVCGSAAEVRDELERLRLEAAVAAESRGLRVVAAGTHPFSRWENQVFTKSPRYEQLRAEYRRLADSQNIFGMHIHVGVPDGVDRVRLMNVVRHYSPYLVALSASSPFIEGDDTGYCSYRSIYWRRWPRSGPPPRFRDGEEYRRLRETMLETGCIDAPGRLYWEMRPHYSYPTLEFRAADVTPRLEDAVAIAALARAIVFAAARGELREPDLPDSMMHPFLVENAWRASRDGMDASFVDLLNGDPTVVPARESLERLIERLRPAIRATGDVGAIESLSETVERGVAATRIRQRAARGKGKGMSGLVHWLADETVLGLGLDRRTEQRNA